VGLASQGVVVLNREGRRLRTLSDGFDDPSGVAVTADGEFIVATDDLMNRTVVLSANGKQVTSFTSDVTSPVRVALDSQLNIYLVGYDQLVAVHSLNGTHLHTFSDPSYSPASAIAVGDDGTIYIGVMNQDGTTPPRIIALSTNGTVQHSFDLPLDVLPTGITVDHAGRIYIANGGDSDVLVVLDRNGTTLASVSADWIAAFDVALNREGEVLLTDLNNNRIAVLEGFPRSVAETQLRQKVKEGAVLIE